jgi:hypothetical protein
VGIAAQRKGIAKLLTYNTVEQSFLFLIRKGRIRPELSIDRTR